MKKRIAIIGTYLPRKCGIATFSSDLFNNIQSDEFESWVVAINDQENVYNYPPEVKFKIRQNIIRDYIAASEFLNINHVDVVCLQHEYGIFGGEYGRFVLQLIKRLKSPLVTTLHTILDDPTNEQKEILWEIANFSEKVVVMTERGKKMLNEIYNIDLEKIKIIGHGIHDTKTPEITNYREELALKDKKVLLTFGLLSKNKGIETVIKSLPAIIEQYPETVYIVLGASHPHVVKNEGEDYRNSLIMLTQKLNLEKNVIFVDRFVSNEELFTFLETSDIYVIPYLSKKQITSGTLVYAMGADNAMVSTPFWHAEEALAEDRGLFFDFHDSDALSKIVIDLLHNEAKLKHYQNKAADYAQHYLWENVGKEYLSTFKDASFAERNSLSINEAIDTDKIFPELNLNHLYALTDDTGILQHARYNIPDRRHGYCLDDNARALLLTVLLKKKLGEDEKVNRLFSTYLSFIDHAYNPEIKKFRNFMSFDRKWLEEAGSQDSQGRTAWALGTLFAHTYNSNTLGHLENLYNHCLEIIPDLHHPRAISYSILGLYQYLNKRTEVKNNSYELLKIQSQKLYDMFEPHLDNSEWPWYDEKVTYGNCRIPEALLYAGKILNDKKLTDAGIQLLDWLILKQFSNNYFSPIGNNGWLSKKNYPQFDQQPIEAYCMIDACLAATSVANDKKYEKYARKAFDWFLGNNAHGLSLYDFSTGGCRDGLHIEGLNKNQGAESTLSWLSSLLQIRLYI